MTRFNCNKTSWNNCAPSLDYRWSRRGWTWSWYESYTELKLCCEKNHRVKVTWRLLSHIHIYIYINTYIYNHIYIYTVYILNSTAGVRNVRIKSWILYIYIYMCIYAWSRPYVIIQLLWSSAILLGFGSGGISRFCDASRPASLCECSVKGV